MYPRKTYGTPKEETSGKKVTLRDLFFIYIVQLNLWKWSKLTLNLEKVGRKF